VSKGKLKKRVVPLTEKAALHWQSFIYRNASSTGSDRGWACQGSKDSTTAIRNNLINCHAA